MTLKAVHHVQISIPKGSENEARAFYRDVLGLKEIPKPDSLAGRGGFWLELGETQIHFGTEDGVDRAKTKGHAAYLVEDLEGWRRKLAAASCDVIDGIPIPGYDRFEFRDPFGNRVEFLQRKA
jgi:catechol 2,3-dioxygenase-like lactoylglutathione lyase family enzyme